jgi:hypothetical protein
MAKPRTLEGYKGSTRNFMAPVSESKFSGDKFKFTDEDDNFVNYVMNNKAGKPIQKNEILNLAEGNVIYPQNLQLFSGLSYFTVNDEQEFRPTLTDGYRLRNNSVIVKINGVTQISNSDQTSSTNADVYLTPDLNYVRVKKKQSDGIYGITLIDRDKVEIKFQKEAIV